MKINNPISPASQVRNLLIVFASGIGLAVLLTLASLYYYNPSGSYLAGNVLLSPDSLKSMRFADGSSKSGGTPHFVFDSIEFLFFNTQERKWEKKAISTEEYSRFYALVSKQKSLEDVPEDLKGIFHKSHLATLILKVRTDNSSAGQAPAIIVTQVELTPEGDYYRVQLREQNKRGEGWVYFQQPGVYQKTFKFFNLTL